MVGALYKPRRPKTSPLYQSISGHFSEFESVYEERYQKRYGVLRDVVREVVYKYLGCGDLKKGFARIKCKSCHQEILLAFSCKGRYFCPLMSSEKGPHVRGVDHGGNPLCLTP